MTDCCRLTCWFHFGVSCVCIAGSRVAAKRYAVRNDKPTKARNVASLMGRLLGNEGKPEKLAIE